MPVSAAYLSHALPPHLRPLLTARALLPRIGGAAFMMGGLSLQEEHAPGRAYAAGDGAAAAAAVPEGGSAAAVMANGQAAVVTAAAPAAAGTAADATATATIQAAADGKLGRQPNKPPLSPFGAAAAAAAVGGGPSAALARRSRSVSGSGARTPPGDVTVPAGLVYKQGSVGAALVAEALRQELAEQLAAAAAASARSGLPPRGRSRSLSPLPRRSLDGSRHTSPLPRPPAAGGQQAAGGSSTAGAAGPAGAAGMELPPAVPLFPGLRRAGSGPASGGGASGSSTPRLRVALPPPPPRRSTHVSQRVQDQVGVEMGQGLCQKRFCWAHGSRMSASHCGDSHGQSRVTTRVPPQPPPLQMEALEPLLSGSSTPARRSSEL